MSIVTPLYDVVLDVIFSYAEKELVVKKTYYKRSPKKVKLSIKREYTCEECKKTVRKVNNVGILILCGEDSKYWEVKLCNKCKKIEKYYPGMIFGSSPGEALLTEDEWENMDWDDLRFSTFVYDKKDKDHSYWKYVLGYEKE